MAIIDRFREAEEQHIRSAKEVPHEHGWIQWQGTQVCMDVYCACGAHLHADAEFCFYVKCGACGQVYECGGHIKLWPVNHEPEGTITLTDRHVDGS